MHVIIGGCGRVGSQLADRLAKDGHDVVVVDVDSAPFDRLTDFNGELVVGNVTDSTSLERAGIQRADAFAAVTRLDNANLMAVEIARSLYRVPLTVARLFDPSREDSYRRMGVHYVSGTRLVAAALLNELQAEPFAQHVGMDDDEVEIVDMRVSEGGDGVTVGRFESVGSVRVAVLRRDGSSVLPSPDDPLQTGDVVVAAVRRGGHKRLKPWVEHPSVKEGV